MFNEDFFSQQFQKMRKSLGEVCALLSAHMCIVHRMPLSVYPSFCGVNDLWSYGLGYNGTQHWRSSPTETPKLCIEWWSGCFSRESAISLKSCKIGQRLLLITNRKSHMVRTFDWYQNQWPWMTLNGHYALCFRIHGFFEPHHENLNEDRPVLSVAKM